ncbi:MAG: hypothetical protein DI582_04650 [Azospirillum brasilense]|nr:MAG: hypothetical protein DI582_04650 [Azospirillum brasilense]
MIAMISPINAISPAYATRRPARARTGLAQTPQLATAPTQQADANSQPGTKRHGPRFVIYA